MSCFFIFKRFSSAIDADSCWFVSGEQKILSVSFDKCLVRTLEKKILKELQMCEMAETKDCLFTIPQDLTEALAHKLCFFPSVFAFVFSAFFVFISTISLDLARTKICLVFFFCYFFFFGKAFSFAFPHCAHDTKEIRFPSSASICFNVMNTIPAVN